MNRQSKFLVGGLVVLGFVGYLMVTGMRDAMLYYHTPAELLARVTADASYHDVGVRIGGTVAGGTIDWNPRTLDLHFEVRDMDDPTVQFPVHFNGVVPETFEADREVVLEGRLNQAGVFEAATLLTKCGSRYEAAEEDLRA
jgi:cytochrome c-type biogenesis protein CcmE